MNGNKSREPKATESSPFIQRNTRPPIPPSDANNELQDQPQNAELEVDDLQRKRKILQGDISRIIKKFDELKHRLYTNKERLIEQELAQMEDHSHPMLKIQLEEMETQRAKRIRIADLKREMYSKSFDLEFQTSKDQADLMFTEAKKSIRRALFKYYHNQIVQLAAENQMKYDEVFADADLDQSTRNEMQLLPKHVTPLTKYEIENDLVLMNRYR